MTEIETYQAKLESAVGKGGDDPLIRNAIALMKIAARNNYSLDMSLGGNTPTFRLAATEALATVPQERA